MMQKPLHPGSGNASVPKNLIANPKQMLETLIRTANAENQDSLRWLSRIVSEGLSKSLLQDLDSYTRNAHVVAHFELDKNNETFNWQYEWPNSNQFSAPKYYYAFFVVYAINLGIATRIRKCQRQGCNKYFYGRPNARWCNPKCGSSQRVRNKREKDRRRSNTYESRYL
jgi:hypothetical protein